MTTNEFELMHYGVKGMRWGVRKERTSGKPLESGKGWTINSDGSIDIQKGASLQRVVRGHSGLFGGAGTDLGIPGAMYASFHPKDNVAYEHGFGRAKGLFVKEASRVVEFSAKEPLRSPSPKEATKIYLETLSKNPEHLASARSGLSVITRAQLDRALKNPEDPKSHFIYSIAYDAGNYNSKFAGVNAAFSSALQSRGFNMLMDSSDAITEFHAPVIILNAQQSVGLTSQRVVDRASQETVRQMYIQQTTLSNGRTSVMEQLGLTG